MTLETVTTTAGQDGKRHFQRKGEDKALCGAELGGPGDEACKKCAEILRKELGETRNDL